MSKQIRTRFAPSPTGFMHVGGVRTSLFAWAFARHEGGDFILRIEDTDTSREVAGSVEHIIESLDWLGLDRDEGPNAGGQHGPYRQSQRLEVYRQYAQALIDKGLAYADPYTEAEIATFREQAKERKQAFLYRRHRPVDLATPSDWYGNVALRFRVPEIKRYQWHDEVRGNMSAGEDALDDFILIKADGYPTYNFAHIVDDHEMNISHVIRGEEFLSSMPKFLSLYEAMEIDRPTFVTVPPILNPEGGKKLSKRHGAKDVLEYRDQRYLPAAVINFLASLGWNDGTTQEVFTPEEIVAKFEVKRIQKSGAKFDETKLDWLQWQHLKLLLKHNATDYLQRLDILHTDEDTDFLTKAAHLAASKSASESDFHEQMKIFTDYQAPDVTTEWLKKIDNSLDGQLAKQYLEASLETLSDAYDDEAAVEANLRQLLSDLSAKPRALLNLLRWSVSGSEVSPGLFEMISLLGKNRVETRVNQVLMQLDELS